MDTETLISNVFQRPEIWDKRLKEYSNRYIVDGCWQDIAKHMGVADHAMLRKKWKYLRDQFSVEIGKLKPSQSGDPAEESDEPKWPHYKTLLFLKDVVKPRIAGSNSSKKTSQSPGPSKETIAGNERETVASSEDVDNKTEEESYEEDVQDVRHNQDFDFDKYANSRNTPHPNRRRVQINTECNEEDVRHNQDFEEDSSIQSTPHSKRRRVQANAKYNETIIEMETKKLQLLHDTLRNRQIENDDMFFFRSLLPHVSMIPDNMKLRFRCKIQQVVDEFAYHSDPSNFNFHSHRVLLPSSSLTESSDTSRTVEYASSPSSPVIVAPVKHSKNVYVSFGSSILDI